MRLFLVLTNVAVHHDRQRALRRGDDTARNLLRLQDPQHCNKRNQTQTQGRDAQLSVSLGVGWMSALAFMARIMR